MPNFTVIAGNGFDLYFSSTNPQHLRLQLLNSDADAKIHMSIYYNIPHQINVYLNDALVAPIAEPNTLPTLDDATGTNVYDFATNLLHVVLDGDSRIDINIQSQIVIALELPPMSVDEFFGEQLAQNLAAFLGISPDRIRVAEIVAEDSRRRKRSDSTMVKVIIQQDEVATLGDDNEAARAEMQANNVALVDAVQMGTISEETGVQVLSASIEEPLPEPGSDAWNDTVARLEDGDSLAVQIQVRYKHILLISLSCPSVINRLSNQTRNIIIHVLFVYLNDVSNL